MITALEIAAVLLVVFLVGSFVFYGLKRRGPWGSFWTFILVIFLGVILFDLWSEPIGPLYYGIAWVDLVIVSLIFAFLLAAATPGAPPVKKEEDAVSTDSPGARNTAVAVGMFFWFLVALFILAIFFRIFI
jgi:hypothetical protein